MTDTVRTFVAAIRSWLQAAAKRRAQRIALEDLLSMNAARLDDLGLNRHDVIEAIAASRGGDTDLATRAQARLRRTVSRCVFDEGGPPRATRYFAPRRNSTICAVLAMITRSRSKLIFLT